MRSLSLVVLLFSAPLFGSGCGIFLDLAPDEDAEIDADDYQRACRQDDDCALVIEGDVCGCGPLSAIRRRDLTKYHRDRDAAAQRCDGVVACAPLER